MSISNRRKSIGLIINIILTNLTYITKFTCHKSFKILHLPLLLIFTPELEHIDVDPRGRESLSKSCCNFYIRLGVLLFVSMWGGRICMDQCIVDISDIPSVEVGDEVILFGGEPTQLDDLARIAGTINYELVCLIGKRVARMYSE